MSAALSPAALQAAREFATFSDDMLLTPEQTAGVIGHSASWLKKARLAASRETNPEPLKGPGYIITHVGVRYQVREIRDWLERVKGAALTRTLTQRGGSNGGGRPRRSNPTAARVALQQAGPT